MGYNTGKGKDGTGAHEEAEGNVLSLLRNLQNLNDPEGNAIRVSRAAKGAHVDFNSFYDGTRSPPMVGHTLLIRLIEVEQEFEMVDKFINI